ncbi:uncharacterized protein V6R79_000850 [Siganus canaliculatus]
MVSTVRFSLTVWTRLFFLKSLSVVIINVDSWCCCRWILIMKSSFLIILIIISGVWSQDVSVTFRKDQCALKGSSIVIECEYDPDGYIVRSVYWSKLQYVSGQEKLYPLSELSLEPNHYRFVGNKRSDCSLQINNVKFTDEGHYYFTFETFYTKYTSKTSLYLSVKELITVIQPSTVTEGDNVRLTCVSDCLLRVNKVWYKDGLLVPQSTFRARREHSGSYYCAVRGQERIRSASMALTVRYAPEKVTLSMSPSEDYIRGNSVSFTCDSDASPPVTPSGYSLYKDGQFISFGSRHTISDLQPHHTGLYHCQAWNSISRDGVQLINSTEVHLDVRYPPTNISISMDPLHVVPGSSVNLTCSGDANPATDSYTWYKRLTETSSVQQVTTGQLLSIPSAEASDSGLYHCQARNRLGENNSTEQLLLVMEEAPGAQSLPVLAGTLIVLCVIILIALLLLWWKKRAAASEKKLTSGGSDLRSSTTEDEANAVYINIHSLPSLPPFINDKNPHSQESPHPSTSCEDEVTYSTVAIKARNSKALQDKRPAAGDNDESVIYATVAKSK